MWLKVHRSGGDPKTPMSCRPPPKESTQPSQHYLGLGSRKRSVNPQPPKGTLTQHRASVLPMGAPGYAKTFIIQLQCRANSWEALSPFTIPPASPALSALTSCSLSAAGSGTSTICNMYPPLSLLCTWDPILGKFNPKMCAAPLSAPCASSLGIGCLPSDSLPLGLTSVDRTY